MEYKRGTDAGVINQGLYYMAWLTTHKDALRGLVRDRLGTAAASQILWSAPRLICVAGDFTRYDAHAVRQHRRSIDLVRYRYYGGDYTVLRGNAPPESGSLPRPRWPGCDRSTWRSPPP